MPDFNEENYLDSLLQEVETEESNSLNNREKYIKHLEDEEIIDDQPQPDPIPETQEQIEEKIIKKQVEEADEKIKTETSEHSANEEYINNESHSNNSDQSNNHDSIISDDNSNKSFENETDLNESELSESEKERLSDMSLDEIIEDVHADSISVNELFSNHDNSVNTSDNNKVDNNDTLKDIHVEETEKTLTNEQLKDEVNDSNIENDQKSSDVTLDHTESAQDEIQSDSRNQIDEDILDGIPEELLQSSLNHETKEKNAPIPKVNKKQMKKELDKVNKKKGFMSKLKDIFFESLDEEDTANQDENVQKAKKASKAKAKKAAVPDVSVAIDSTLLDDSILDESKENAETHEAANSNLNNELDENEKLIKEMYGSVDETVHLDEDEAPKKGFFAKLKYRLAEHKKKSQEEEKAELEAEEIEQEEKRQKKEQKKVIKDKKKEEKKAAPKKEKKPKKVKEKKPKKVKEPPKPGDILRIKPKSIVFFVLFISGICVLVQILNISFSYSNVVNQANVYIQNGDYEKAYDKLSGVDLKKKDQTIYRQATVVMYVEGQYNSYVNCMKNNEKAKALESLIKGLDRYYVYYNEASELGVRQELEQTRNQIISALNDSFQISESQASELMIMMQNDFTGYYKKIQTYER